MREVIWISKEDQVTLSHCFSINVGERPPLCIMLLKNCRTEAQFYQAYVNAILKASFTKMNEFMLAAKRYVGSFGPKISLSDSLKCLMIIMIQL